MLESFRGISKQEANPIPCSVYLRNLERGNCEVIVDCRKLGRRTHGKARRSRGRRHILTVMQNPLLFEQELQLDLEQLLVELLVELQQRREIHLWDERLGLVVDRNHPLGVHRRRRSY